MASNTESIKVAVASENVAVVPAVNVPAPPVVPAVSVAPKAKAAPKGMAKKKARVGGDAPGASAPSSGAAVMVSADQENYRAVQQRFNQFLKYTTTKASNEGRVAEAKHLADLYHQCASGTEKRAFIARWSKQGGAKQNLQLFFQQELRSTQESSSAANVGHMTAGKIGSLEGVTRELY
eukprot:3513739-Amphidinium_carterae.1